MRSPSRCSVSPAIAYTIALTEQVYDVFDDHPPGEKNARRTLAETLRNMDARVKDGILVDSKDWRIVFKAPRRFHDRPSRDEEERLREKAAQRQREHAEQKVRVIMHFPKDW